MLKFMEDQIIVKLSNENFLEAIKFINKTSKKNDDYLVISIIDKTFIIGCLNNKSTIQLVQDGNSFPWLIMALPKFIFNSFYNTSKKSANFSISNSEINHYKTDRVWVKWIDEYLLNSLWKSKPDLLSNEESMVISNYFFSQFFTLMNLIIKNYEIKDFRKSNFNNFCISGEDSFENAIKLYEKNQFSDLNGKRYTFSIELENNYEWIKSNFGGWEEDVLVGNHLDQSMIIEFTEHGNFKISLYGSGDYYFIYKKMFSKDYISFDSNYLPRDLNSFRLSQYEKREILILLFFMRKFIGVCLSGKYKSYLLFRRRF
jgi:hypothetical protein